MNAVEAHRQYQATLEAARPVRHALRGIVSAEDELVAVNEEVASAYDVACDAWAHHEIERALGEGRR